MSVIVACIKVFFANFSIRVGLAQWLASRTTDLMVPGSRPGRVAVRCGLEQVTFTPCLILVKPRKPWTYDWLGQTVTRLETTLCIMFCPRDLVSRPDKIDETVLHTLGDLVIIIIQTCYAYTTFLLCREFLHKVT